MANKTGYTLADIQAAYAQGLHASTTSNPADWFVNWARGSTKDNDAGVAVTYNTSLTYAYVWAAVSMISGDVASLPLNVYDLDENGDKSISRNSQAQWLLNEEPNDVMDALTFREVLTSHVLLWGNAYAAIERDGAMRPTRLVVMLPDATEPLLDDNGRLFYRNWKSATARRRAAPSDYIDLLPRDVLHLRGLGWDGIAGHSVISLARNSWGLGMAAQKHGAKHFAQGARPSIALTTESKLDEKTADTLLQRWEERHAGESRPALLTNGLTIQPYSMSNDDAQWLESRAFQRVEVAAWFRMPPHKLGDDSRIAYNSIESENRSYLNQCLKIWLKRWESEARRKLLTDRDRRSYRRRIEHDTQDLISADIETQTDVLVKLRNAEILNRNEVRRKLGWASTEGGDDFTNPNVRPAERSPNDSDTPNGDAPAAANALNARALSGQHKLLAHSLDRMISIETKAATRAAEKEGNFVAWVDDFYDRFQGKISEAIDPVLSAYNQLPGVESCVTATQAAQLHVDASQAMLLEVAGYSDADSLADNVTEAVQAWPNRATIEATTFLGGMDDGA